MRDDQACCACNRVKYSPATSVDTPGALVERWVCEDCGAVFIREPMRTIKAMEPTHAMALLDSLSTPPPMGQRTITPTVAAAIRDCMEVLDRAVADRERAEELRVSTAKQLDRTQEDRDKAQAKVYALADLVLEGDRVLPLLRALGIDVGPDGDQWCATYHNTFQDPQASAIGYGPTPVVAADLLLSQLARVDLMARSLAVAYQVWAETPEGFVSEDVIEGFSNLMEVTDHGLGLGESIHGGWLSKPKGDGQPEVSGDAKLIADCLAFRVRYHNLTSQWVATLEDGGLCDPHGTGDTSMVAVRGLVAELVRRSRAVPQAKGSEPRTCDNCGLTDAERKREYQAGREAGKPRAWCARDTLGLPLPPCCDAWEPRPEDYPEEGRYEDGRC